jgi:hypothetical protein
LRYLFGLSAIGLLMGSLFVSGTPSGAAASSHGNSRELSSPAASAYVYNNFPTRPSYAPESAYRFNSSGQGVSITRSSRGKYEVVFYGLGPEADQGTVDVTAEGESNPAVCSVAGWAPNGSNLEVSVDCYAVTGAALSTPFMASFTSGGSTTGTVDYVLANNANARSYTPDLTFQFNSSGGTNRITRPAKGEYVVALPGPDTADGTVKVTAFGSGADSCQVVEWLNAHTGQDVYVDCFTTAGALVDHEFTMTFAASDSLLGGGGANGYVWANNPTSSSYAPALAYQYDWVGTTDTAMSFGTGEYTNSFPSASEGDHGDEQATAYGSTDTHCIVDGPAGGSGGTQGADVFCFDTSGNLVNSLYTMQWMVN